MKIIHLNFSTQLGGAAIAARRLNEALKRSGADSKMLCLGGKESKDEKVVNICSLARFIKFKTYMYLQKHILKKYKCNTAFSLQFLGLDLSEHPDVASADIVFLHWVNYSMLSISAIENILKSGKPVYWFMHDMFPFTGGCHHSFGCEGYKRGCDDCIAFDSYRGTGLAGIQLRKKIDSWSKYNNFHAISPSRWLAGCAKESLLLSNRKVMVCPNVIDTDLFRPARKDLPRKRFGISGKRTVILVGAQDFKNKYKGWDYLVRSLNILNPEKYECLVFGESCATEKQKTGIDMHFTGYLDNTEDIIAAYNAADIFVTPSLAENFPNVLVEAMACGIPCVGFDVGGIPDIIHNKTNGYLAEYKDCEDLARGIELTTLNKEEYGKAAREFVCSNLSYCKVKDIYREIL